MKVQLRKISGVWDSGWVLDKHTIKSTFLGYDGNGHARYDTHRTEVGEATYQLKYNGAWDQMNPLAQSIVENICPKLSEIGFIVPMPASTARERQPVTEIANSVGAIVAVPVFTNTLLKAKTGKQLKNLTTKEEKIEAIGGSFSINDEIKGNGPWNVLIIDDLYHTGASMEAACKVLRLYPKVKKIYVAALTWK